MVKAATLTALCSGFLTRAAGYVLKIGNVLAYETKKAFGVSVWNYTRRLDHAPSPSESPVSEITTHVPVDNEAETPVLVAQPRS